MFEYKKSIAKQFILRILLFSMVITTILTGIQLYSDYEIGLNHIHQKALLVERSYLKSITDSVWKYDQEVLKVQLVGISEIPDFQYISIVDKDTEIISLGTNKQSNVITKSFPLTKQFLGETKQIGTLNIVFTLDGLYTQLLNTVYIVAISQAIKTLLVSLFIFYMFYLLIGRYLGDVTRYANNLNASTLSKKLVLNKQANKSSLDEIDRLVLSLNQMRENFNLYKVKNETAQNNLKISEDRYRQIFENNQAVKLIIDSEDGAILECNESAINYYGYDEQTLTSLKISDINAMPAKEVEQAVSDIKNKQINYLKTQHKLASGEIRDVEVYPSPIISENKTLNYAIVFDITERLRAEKALITQSAITRNMMEGAILMKLGSGEILYINNAARRLFGYEADELIGQNITIINAPTTKTPEQRTDEIMQQIMRHQQWQGEVRNVKKDGTKIWCSVNSSVFHHPEYGEVCISVNTDITFEKSQQEKLKYLANYDFLTDLPNRALLNNRAEQMIAKAKRESSSIALIFIDIDEFKKINDVYGHEFGDKTLIHLAQLLKSKIRINDTLARLGGDEFVALLQIDTDVLDITHLAQKLIDSVNKPFSVDGITINLSTSLGISLFPDDASSFDTLLRNADSAMYKAKECGKNNLQYYLPELTRQAEQRIQLENDIAQALLNQEFIVYYQPQIDTQNQQIIGAEALVRWNSPQKGLVPPIEFIPFAEKSGQIKAIDKWVLETVANFIAKAHSNNIAVPKISVNFSAIEIDQSPLCSIFNNILLSSGCDPTFLELEVTESGLMQNQTKCIDELNKLKALGVNIAIDDFGTGYSSLSYLKNLPIDKLKIDQEFIRELIESPDNQAIVRAIIALGSSLNMELIAEGVETNEQKEFLLQEGCHEVQGYLYCKPLPEQQFIEFLNDFK